MDVDCANHVGAPYPNLKLRLKDVPEMGYFSHHDPPTGEICFKGLQTTPGYFKNPEKTDF